MNASSNSAGNPPVNPVAKALWYVENNFAGELTLDQIAEVAGVSRYHVSRAFGEAIGRPITRYVRGRRLTEAAKALASGASDILTVALESGYGSHEAFTRAFREQFGQTPESVRAQRHLDNLELVEAVSMNYSVLKDLAEPRFETRKAFLVAGLSARYDYETCGGGIPAQWQRFAPHLGNVPGQVGSDAYGVRYNSDDSGLDYLCGVEVGEFASLPPELSRVRVPANRYAVFTHRGHISAIRSTWATVWNKWLPQSGHQLADAPDFERYDARFDARSGNGEVEIWVPLKG
ncbi:MAG TPA: AraC family transcriptional regulator [Steroidobacteraceae bacterium]|nr:AraC family transcriptional regulator [Steroidobacteraceae bacterium]